MERRIALIAGMCASVLSAWLCWKVLGLIPHVPDELAYLFQGRIFASGRLSIDPPAVPEAFTVPYDHIYRTADAWRAMYPPGWPLLLAVGWLIQTPWLINPILLCVSVLGVFHLARQLFDARTGMFAAIAFACSPFVLLMSAGQMSHPSALCAAIWCAVFLTRTGAYYPMIGGAIGSYAFSIRPYTSFALLLPWIVWRLSTSDRKTKVFTHLAVGALPVLIFFAIYNHHNFGSVLRTGYSYDPEATFYGSLFDNFIKHVPWYFAQLNDFLWGWPWPDLMILLPLFLPHKNWKHDLLLVISFLSLLTAYAIFYYTDIVYSGTRYLFEALGFLMILAGRAIRIMEERTGRWAVIGLLLLFAFPLAVRLPGQIEYHAQAYHGQSSELLDLVEAQGIGDSALIFISGDPFVFRTFLLENGLNPVRSGRVFARDIPELRDEIIRAYPREEIWLMKIELIPLPGINRYNDRFQIGNVRFDVLSNVPRASLATSH